MKKHKMIWAFTFTLSNLFSPFSFAQNAEFPVESETPAVNAEAPPPPPAAATPTNLPQKKKVRKDLTLPDEKRSEAAAEKKDEKKEDKKEEKKSGGIDAEEIFKSLDYPELQVVPRATDRVQYEAQLENDNGYFLHWPLHVSSLSSLGLGLYARGRYKADPSDTEKREADLASTTAIGVGVFWLAATGVIHYGRPYASILNRAKKTKEKDRRGELFRERIAEEGMEANAKMIRTLAFLSILSNAYAAFTVGINHDPGVSKIAFGVGVLAFTPWVFEHRYLNIYEKHLEYKRKIYTPISYLDFGVDQKSQQLYPKLAMQWSF